MIFLFENLSGQLCNRLWSFVPAYTYARKHHSGLHILFENPDYVSLFPDARRSRYLKFWFTAPFWHKVLFMRMVESFLQKRQIHGELRECGYSPFRIQSVNGWGHRGDLSFTDDADIKASLCRVFAFSSQVQRKVRDSFGEFTGVTVGLHVRRGDYREWKGGRYFYDDDAWIRWMYSIKNQIVIGGECRFLIASNESLICSAEGLDIIRVHDADGITDLCALSRCDYIIGPPSTYSQWASFVGDVPLHFVLSPDEDIDIKDFSPVVRQDVLADGRKLQWRDESDCFVLI